MERNMLKLYILIGYCQFGLSQRLRSECYEYDGNARRCMPPFENAAYGVAVEATNTCGSNGGQAYCLQVGITGATKSCDYCDARDPYRRHPAEYLTDFHDRAKVTAWQSETMLEGVQYPTIVNLTLHLRKSFDITYVRLKFYSSRPESFAIYKRTHENGPWIPYQFYSASCEETYHLNRKATISREDETLAVCTNEFSDISPLTGGSVAFSTLEGRPSAYNFENSPVLQKWVTATDIRILLTRMNTFGDEVFGDPNVLQSYFYAISDFAVGGRCKCNGHARECVRRTNQALEDSLVCACEHHTAGADCERCDDFYNDQPWKRATLSESNACKPCECNGLSNRCYFDEEMWRDTAHGGHCVECRDDTAGVHCERCKEDYYRRDDRQRCTPCDCDPVGSATTQCDRAGRCECKAGVTGGHCGSCLPNYYDFSDTGCRPCACSEGGSRDNNPTCLPDTGTCTCKELTEGQNCDRCKPGHFNLALENPYGCMSCFCYGHSSVCSSAEGYSRRSIESTFDTGAQRWSGIDEDGNKIRVQYDRYNGKLGITAPSFQTVYFSAPARFLGDQRFLYDQFFEFTLRLERDSRIEPSINDIILEGSGLRVACPIYSQGNAVPSNLNQEFKFRLNEHRDYQWTPQLNAFDFIRLLSNVTAIRIRATYMPGGRSFLDNVVLHSARRGYGSADATHVEQCTCPTGYIGQFCEDCEPGYTRDPPYSGALARCVPCNCNGHSQTCDTATGRCICKHNTAGDNCELCTKGYYGYALAGTTSDCKKCPCPNGGECVEMLNGEVVCINCEEGYTGNRCEVCVDGYFGDRTGRFSTRQHCQKCICNDNVDYNAVQNCNGTTGECVKCIYNTGGHDCGRCLAGYYGDALAAPKGDCKACGCYVMGSRATGSSGELILCHEVSGQCPCLPSVVGRQCDMCVEGYWNIDSGFGCDACRCDDLGSYNNSCDMTTGQCVCKQGVGGQNCDVCLENHYAFRAAGCQECECYAEGSTDLQCDLRTGQCPCQENVEGRRCDRCMENKYNITAGCEDCPTCYDLVQERVHLHREKLAELSKLIDDVAHKPQGVNDTEFLRRLKTVNDSVVLLHTDSLKLIGSGSPLTDQMEDNLQSVADLMTECANIRVTIDAARDAQFDSDIDVKMAESALDNAEKQLQSAETTVERDGQAALRDAHEAQDRLGQQSSQMTDIARQAREEVERQEAAAAEIRALAQSALNTSQEAVELAHEALSEPARTASEIKEMHIRAQAAEGMYDNTVTMAERAHTQAKEAYEDALNIYTEASELSVPDVDMAALRAKAESALLEAERIRSEATLLLDNHEQLMDDVQDQKSQAEDLLVEGNHQQQIADELLANVDAARGIAKDSIEKSESTIAEADATLKTLKEFESKKQASKEAADAALDRIPAIAADIEAAEAQTAEARAGLAGAEQDAAAARDLAQHAQQQAEHATTEAGTISAEAAQTRDRAEELKAQAMQHAVDVSEVGARLDGYTAQALEDEQLATQALQKADAAKQSAHAAETKVTSALNVVTAILDTLASLDIINIAALDDLEKSLDTVQEQITAADLDARYEQLYSSHQTHEQWVHDYANELINLKEDVENVRIINETIPRGCFRSIDIEPTDPTG